MRHDGDVESSQGDVDTASVVLQLAQQRALLEAWLQSDDAREYSRSLTRRRPGGASPDELISEAWLRLQRVFDRREVPYPDLSTERNAARFMARLLDNLSRDLMRRALRRNETELVDSIATEPSPMAHVDTRVVLQHLVVAVGRRSRHSDDCPDCHQAVVAAAALEVLHLVLTDHDGVGSGATVLDRLLYEALDRVSGDRSPSDAARRQRKARCGRCITALLEQGLRDIGEAA